MKNIKFVAVFISVLFLTFSINQNSFAGNNDVIDLSIVKEKMNKKARYPIKVEVRQIGEDTELFLPDLKITITLTEFKKENFKKEYLVGAETDIEFINQGLVITEDNKRIPTVITFNKTNSTILLPDFRIASLNSTNKTPQIKLQMTIKDQNKNIIDDPKLLLIQEKSIEPGIKSKFEKGIWTVSGTLEEVNNLLRGNKIEIGKKFNSLEKNTFSVYFDLFDLTDPNNPKLSYITDIKFEEEIIVSYLKEWKKLSETINTGDCDSSDSCDSFNFYKVGTFINGKYKDGALAIFTHDIRGSICEKDGCDGLPFIHRFAIVDKKAIFLPRISDDMNYDHSEVFKKLGFVMEKDVGFTIPILEHPKKRENIVKTKFQNKVVFLRYDDEEIATSAIDKTKLKLLFSNTEVGEVYVEKGPVIKLNFSNPSIDQGLDGNEAMGDLCSGDCNLLNKFFVFRPDGTYLNYHYIPNINGPKTFALWNDNTKLNIIENYIGTGFLNDCNEDCGKILQKAGTIQNVVSKTTFYEFSDKNHLFYKQFYDGYLKAYDHYNNQSEKPKTYEEFINSKPIFIWKDSFDRFMIFSNKKFISFLAEPIIYLYPIQKQKIEVSLKLENDISASSPKYENGWKVIADEFGKITNISDGKNYPYLFWESPIYTFPIRKDGFVIKKSEIESFLKKIMPKMGLNEKETKDFIKAWKTKLSGSKYCFITFVDSKIIDEIAPLNISPKPDTVIRILMDFKPLKTSIKVPEFQLPEVPLRKGFTVIEWGGVQR